MVDVQLLFTSEIYSLLFFLYHARGFGLNNIQFATIVDCTPNVPVHQRMSISKNGILVDGLSSDWCIAKMSTSMNWIMNSVN